MRTEELPDQIPIRMRASEKKNGDDDDDVFARGKYRHSMSRHALARPVGKAVEGFEFLLNAPPSSALAAVACADLNWNGCSWWHYSYYYYYLASSYGSVFALRRTWLLLQ